MTTNISEILCTNLKNITQFSKDDYHKINKTKSINYCNCNNCNNCNIQNLKTLCLKLCNCLKKKMKNLDSRATSYKPCLKCFSELPRYQIGHSQIALNEVCFPSIIISFSTMPRRQSSNFGGSRTTK